MASILVCPHCFGELKVAKAPALGTAVRCYVCKQIFKAEEVEDDAPSAPKPKQQPQPKPAPQKLVKPAAPAPRIPPAAAQQPVSRPQQPMPQAQYPYGQQPTPYGQQPMMQQPLLQQPTTDTTPAWVTMLTIGAGGFGVLVLLVVFMLAITRATATPPVVAQVPPPQPIQPAPVVPTPAPTVPATTPAPVYGPAPVKPAIPEPPPTPAPVPVEVATNNPPPATTGNPFTPSAPTEFGSTPPGAGPIEDAPPTPAMKYGWENGKQYPYEFSLSVQYPNGPPVIRVGTVHYIPSFAETERVREILKGESAGQGSGTGFVIHSDGYLVTCHHVIKGGSEINVTLQGKKYPARVIIRDPQHDLAVLKIAATGLPTVPLGDSTNLGLLEDCVAVGFPLSDVLGTSVKATQGTIAGIVNEGTSLIQVQAGINPGNSGGPLFNDKGEVIGVCSAKLVGEEISNVGFAVPVNDLKTLLQTKRVTTNGVVGPKPEKLSAMVQKVQHAVAYIEVKMGVDTNLYQVLSVSGSSLLDNSTVRCNGEVLTSNVGEVVAARADEMLPHVIGSFATMAIEKLPEDDETTWEASRMFTTNVAESIGGGGRPGRPSAPIQTLSVPVPVIDKKSYRLGSKEGDVTTFHKKHQIVAIKEVGKAKMFASVGEGTVQFDTKRGCPTSCRMKYDQVFVQQGTELKITIDFEYKLKAL